jgi:hypothetical protein
MQYKQANTDWLAACRYGIGLHWTALSAPRHGQPLAFQEEVEQFRLKECVAAIGESGADYVIFTATHALHKLPCPHPVVDEISPGRTCRRDLLAELAAGLQAAGKRLIVHYNHRCNGRDDLHWKEDVGLDQVPPEDRPRLVSDRGPARLS